MRKGTTTPLDRPESDTTPSQLRVTGAALNYRCEFELLRQATADLKNAFPTDLGRNPLVQIRLGEALVRNQAIWSTLVREAVDQKKQFPEDIQNLLRNLHIYVDANSRKVLNEAEDGDLEMLIMINQNVINGLQALVSDVA